MRARGIEWESFSEDPTGDPAMVRQVERQWGVTFPASYKEVVDQIDHARPVGGDAFEFHSRLVGHPVVHGVGEFIGFKNPGDNSWYMARLQSHPPEDFPKGLVPFSLEGGGDLVCFDYRADRSATDPPVVVWHLEGEPGSGQEVSPVASNFDAFIGMLYDDEA